LSITGLSPAAFLAMRGASRKSQSLKTKPPNPQSTGPRLAQMTAIRFFA
jgi:hypothetical protein